MAEKYSVSLNRIIEEFQLETLYIPEDRKVLVESSDISRPGLPLTGYFGYFDLGYQYYNILYVGYCANDKC